MGNDQKAVWERLFSKRDRYGLEQSTFAKYSWEHIKKINATTLLELGCGEGRDVMFFAGKGLSVTGVDFSDKAIASLKEKIKGAKLEGKVVPVLDDVRNLSRFDDNTFDVVYSHLSLHYFTDKQTTKLFSEMYRILKNNGLLIFRVKSTDDVLYGKGEKIERDMYSFEGHIRHFFSKEYLLSKVQQFDVREINQLDEPLHSGSSANTWTAVVQKKNRT